MIVLDASVLIGHLESADPHHSRASELLRQFADRSFGVSPLTLAEVLVGPARCGRIDDATNALWRLGVATVPFDEHAPQALAKLRADTGLKLPDCCVLVAAQQTGGEVATFDHRLAEVVVECGLPVWDH